MRNQWITFQRTDLTAHQKKIYGIILVAMVLCGLSCFALFMALFEQQDSRIELSLSSDFGSNPQAQASQATSVISAESASDCLFPVYLVGEVMHPGIYMVCDTMFLYQLVEMAGGFTQQAAAENINLAYRLEGNRTIRIPSEEEMKKQTGFGITNDIVSVLIPVNDTGSVDDIAAAKVNINTATQSQLETLPGIGPATAEQIIQYRLRHGPFKRIEDIMNVPGIKSSKFSLLKERIIV